MSDNKRIQKWIDPAMFAAQPIDAEGGPKVELLHCNNDPLGTIAAVAKAYTGGFVGSLAEVTDDERRHYFDDVRRNVLAAPLEFVNFHFRISGVTRAFTHQMVRQRTATYAQESLRFAVKESVPVGLPPSLTGTMPWSEWIKKCWAELFPGTGMDQPLPPEQANARLRLLKQHAQEQASKEQLWRREWDEHVEDVEATYNSLVDSGMPAEDARGLLPTNVLTQLHYTTDLRHLIDHAGLRLCTQAQFEWRLVWRGIISAIRNYGKTQQYAVPETWSPVDVGHARSTGETIRSRPSAWQFTAIAGLFKPICYKTGKCEFMSEHDRHCTIRDRVNAFAAHGIKSEYWDNPTGVQVQAGASKVTLPPINDSEWMADPKAARE